MNPSLLTDDQLPDENVSNPEIEKNEMFCLKV